MFQLFSGKTPAVLVLESCTVVRMDELQERFCGKLFRGIQGNLPNLPVYETYPIILDHEDCLICTVDQRAVPLFALLRFPLAVNKGIVIGTDSSSRAVRCSFAA